MRDMKLPLCTAVEDKHTNTHLYVGRGDFGAELCLVQDRSIHPVCLGLSARRAPHFAAVHDPLARLKGLQLHFHPGLWLCVPKPQWLSKQGKAMGAAALFDITEFLKKARMLCDAGMSASRLQSGEGTGAVMGCTTRCL